MLWTYGKERLGAVLLYLCFVGIFWLVFFLYGVPSDAVRYAFFLSFLLLLLYGLRDFFRFRRRHLCLQEMKSFIMSDLSGLPEVCSALEEDYQQLLEILYQENARSESEKSIARQEMMDYYGMWAHQIKTPIAAMQVLLQANGQEDTSFVRELKLELFKVEQYVEMALTYLRMEDMSGDLVLEVHELDAVIRKAVRKYARMFIAKKIKLNYEPVGQRVLTDDKWLVFVIEQILSNALKYTREGQISICFDREALVISDTGIGIQKEDLPRVFEKGFTGYNGRQDQKSTGIGLYLCKTILDRLRHGIRIESVPGEGTKVYLYLKRAKLEVE